MKLDRHGVTTLLTLVIVGLWMVTFITRVWVEWPPANVLDAAMPMVIGYWFVSNAQETKKNGDGDTNENGAKP